MLAGEQVIDLRKGGLKEDGRHFGIANQTAWLYPTAEHQRPELLTTAYRHWVDISESSPVGQPIRILGWVEIVSHATISEVNELDALSGKAIWTDEYAQQRLKWKSRDPLWVLLMRAHRLDEPLTIPWRDNYGGCTSWVDLTGLPADPRSLPSTPALSDVAFESRSKGAREALGETAWTNPAGSNSRISG